MAVLAGRIVQAYHAQCANDWKGSIYPYALSLSLSLSIYLSIYLSIHLSIYLSFSFPLFAFAYP